MISLVFDLLCTNMQDKAICSNLKSYDVDGTAGTLMLTLSKFFKNLREQLLFKVN